MRAVLVLPLALLAAACGPSAAPHASVLLVVADTLRADALSCDGSGADAPHLCALARAGARFEAAYANAPWTPPSSVALLTGMRPGVHAEAPVERTSRFYQVGQEHELLAERLAARGFDAWAYVENQLAARSQTLQGFEAVEGRAHAPLPAPLDLGDDPRHQRMAGPAERLLRGGLPFFGLVWTLDPHAPYQPPESLLAGLAEEARGLPRPLEFYTGLGHQDAPHRMRAFAPHFRPDELRFVRHLYEAEVTSVDERVGILLAALEARGLRERTFVVFTSDHGEGFGEHGVFLHGKSLHEELVRVPLIVAGPGVAPGTVVRAPVALVDVVPTLCELLETPCGDEVQGVSFAPLLRGEPDRAPVRSIYVAHPNDPSLGFEALVRDGRKLVRGPGDALRLYDLTSDPGELHDVAAEQPAALAALSAELAALRAEDEARRVANLARRSAEERERATRETEEGLRALGYVESDTDAD